MRPNKRIYQNCHTNDSVRLRLIDTSQSNLIVLYLYAGLFIRIAFIQYTVHYCTYSTVHIILVAICYICTATLLMNSVTKFYTLFYFGQQKP